MIRDGAGDPVPRASDAVPGSAVEIQFADGRVGARLDGKTDGPPRRTPREKRGPQDEAQGKLL